MAATIREYPAEVLAAQPIGWWSGEVFRRVVGAIREALAVEGLTQPHWWTLNHAAGEPGRWSRAALTERLRAYDDQETDFDAVYDDLVARGWLTEGQDGMRLTDEGEAGRLRAGERNLAIHRRTHEGVSEADFVTAVNVLRRMVANHGGHGDLPD